MSVETLITEPVDTTLVLLDNFNVVGAITAPPPSSSVFYVDDFNTYPPPPGVPEIPTQLTVDPTDGGAVLSWTHDGTDVLSWRVLAVNGALERTYTVAEPFTRNLAIAGLLNDLVWGISVYAVGESGDSQPITSTVTPTSDFAPTTGVLPDPVPPSAPVLTDVVDGPASIYVTWEASVDDGGRAISSYIVTATATTMPVDALVLPVSSVSVPADTLEVVLLYMINDLEYEVVVQALSSGGRSDPSNMLTGEPTAGSPALLPAPVTSFAAVPRSRGAALSWVNDDLGIGDFVRYDIEVSSTTQSFHYELGVEATSCEIGGLSNSVEYTVSINVVTTVGESAPATDTVEPDSGATVLGTFVLMPIIEDAPPVVVTPKPPRAKNPQPMVEAFPATRNFRPQNWGLTLEEVPAGE